MKTSAITKENTAMRRAIRLSTLPAFILSVTLLSSCAKKPTQTPESRPVLSSQASTYLSQAQGAKTPESATQNQLMAAQTMLDDDNLFGASQEVRRLKADTLTDKQTQTLYLIEADYQLKHGKPYEALLALGKIKNPERDLNTDEFKRYEKIKMHAYAQNNQMAKSLMIALKRYQQSPASDTRMITLWYELQNLPLKTLNHLTSRYHNDNYFTGWLRLAIIAKEFSNHTHKLANALIAWQQQFPDHPGNRLIANHKDLTTLQNSQPPTQIAVLVPETGPLSTLGQMIIAGVMKAYFSTPKNDRIALRFYDSQTGSIEDTYATALNNGAEAVIGPMTRANVKALSGDISVPTIALNYTDTGAQNLIQFGLSPTQEAKQAASHAWQYGVSRVASITPNSDWGQNVAQAFSNQWQSFSGAIIPASLRFKPTNLKQQIANLLGVEAAYQRADTVKDAIKYARNQYIRFIPRRRQDINGIFLAGTPSQAKTITPLLKFYFAGNLPTFATSSIYRPGSSKAYNHDLNGIYFCDSPLLISTAPSMINERQQVKKLWPNAYTHYARLYALGVDSYQLARNEKRVLTLPYFGLQGISGRLYLHANQQIYRQLSWAKMTDGQPKPVD